MNHPCVKNIPFFTGEGHYLSLEVLYKHWYDIHFLPPWGFRNPAKNECQIIAKMNNVYPDNIILCIGNIAELSYFSRIYSNDEIVNINGLADYIK